MEKPTCRDQKQYLPVPAVFNVGGRVIRVRVFNYSLLRVNTIVTCYSGVHVLMLRWFAGVVRAATDGAANLLYDCRSTDMLLPTLLSGDFDSMRCDVLNYYENVVKVVFCSLR